MARGVNACGSWDRTTSLSIIGRSSTVTVEAQFEQTPQVFKKLVPQFGSIKQLKSASHGLVLILGTLNKPVPDVLRDVDLS